MPTPRKTLVSLDATPYYHCVSRCVRQAFLCGADTFSGKDFEHRRQWLEDRLLTVAAAFSIDIAAYAIMSNHYHLVLCINRERALGWSLREVIEHWHQLFKGGDLSQRFIAGESLSDIERDALCVEVEGWRERLMSISWFMRCTNEPIARQANVEDEATGRFWEGRFKSQALLDEKALLACMAYVDLNPVRAKLADTPEQSEYTSIGQRIRQVNKQAIKRPDRQMKPSLRLQVQQIDPREQPVGLLAFSGGTGKDWSAGLPFRLDDYLQLVDWSGRIIREDKKGAIAADAPAILQRLEMGASQFVYLSQHFESPFKNLVGAAHKVRKICQAMGQNWVQGISQCERFFSSQ